MASLKVAEILEGRADAATLGWVERAEGDVQALPDPESAIEAAYWKENIAALQSVVEPKALRKAASAALHKLKSRGIKVEAKVQARSAALGAEVVDIPPRAFVSLPDLLGECRLLLTATDASGTCVAEVPLGGLPAHIGHAHLSRNELRETCKDVARDPRTKEVAFPHGLALAAAAAGDSVPHQLHHLLQKLDPGVWATARTTPIASIPGAEADTGRDGDRYSCLPLELVELRPAYAAYAAYIDGPAESPGEAEESEAEAAATPEPGAAAGPAAEGRDIFGPLVPTAVTDANRAGLALAADLAAAVYRIHGRRAAAGDAASVAEAIRTGELGPARAAIQLSLELAAIREWKQRLAQAPQFGGCDDPGHDHHHGHDHGHGHAAE